jgi:hypothetical protein
MVIALVGLLGRVQQANPYAVYAYREQQRRTGFGGGTGGSGRLEGYWRMFERH